MATPTYVPLATITLASTDSEIVFSSIPATYRDLILIVNATNASTTPLKMQFNGDTGNNYAKVIMGGTGSTTLTISITEDGVRQGNIKSTLTQFSFQVFDYSLTDKHKSVLSRYDDSSNQVVAGAYRWANTAVITSVRFVPEAGSFAIGSTFALYGSNKL